MLLEIDSVVIPDDALKSLRLNDSQSPIWRSELKKDLSGMVLYLHAFPNRPGYSVVSLRQLCDWGVLEAVTLHTDKVP